MNRKQARLLGRAACEQGLSSHAAAAMAIEIAIADGWSSRFLPGVTAQEGWCARTMEKGDILSVTDIDPHPLEAEEYDMRGRQA